MMKKPGGQNAVIGALRTDCTGNGTTNPIYTPLGKKANRWGVISGLSIRALASFNKGLKPLVGGHFPSVQGNRCPPQSPHFSQNGGRVRFETRIWRVFVFFAAGDFNPRRTVRADAPLNPPISVRNRGKVEADYAGGSRPARIGGMDAIQPKSGPD